MGPLAGNGPLMTIPYDRWRKNGHKGTARSGVGWQRIMTVHNQGVCKARNQPCAGQIFNTPVARILLLASDHKQKLKQKSHQLNRRCPCSRAAKGKQWQAIGSMGVETSSTKPSS